MMDTFEEKQAELAADTRMKWPDIINYSPLKLELLLVYWFIHKISKVKHFSFVCE